MKILHISDLQYQDSERKDRIEKFIKKIINYYSDSDEKPLIIYTGDLVEDALESEMKAHRVQLQQFIEAGFEMLLCPGNHDQKMNGFNVRFDDANLIMFSRIFSDLLPKGKHFYNEEDNNLRKWPLVHQYGSYFFVGLNSNEGMHNNYSACGKIKRKQLFGLNKAINDIKKVEENAKIVVYLHHEPFKYKISIPGLPFRWDYQFMKLKKHKKLLNILKGRANVLLFGHYHKFKRRNSSEQAWGINLVLRNAGAIMDGDNKFVEIDLGNEYSLKHL